MLSNFKTSGQVESPSWLIGPLLVMGLFSISIAIIAISYGDTVMTIREGRSELEVLNTEERLLTSSDCISSGELGIIDRNKLDDLEESEGIIEKCPPGPSISYRVRIEDLDTGEEWVLGDKEMGDNIKKNRSVAIQSNADVNSGLVELYFATSQEEPVLAFRKHMLDAWLTGGSEFRIETDDVYFIDFSDGEIKQNGWQLPAVVPSTGEEIKGSFSVSIDGEEHIQIERSDGEIHVGM